MTSAVTGVANPSGAGTWSQDWLIAGLVVTCSCTYAGLAGWELSILPFTTLFAMLGLASRYDLRTRRVPNRLIWVGTVLVATLLALTEVVDNGDRLGNAALGGVVLFGIFLAIHLLSPTRFGAADVKMSFVVGMSTCWFGLQQLSWFLLWTWVALAISALIMRLRGIGTADRVIAFVPIIAAAAAMSILMAAG